MRIDLPRGLVVVAILGVTFWLIRDQQEISETEPEAEVVIEAPSHRFGLARPETRDVPATRSIQTYEDWNAGIAPPATPSPRPQTTPEVFSGYDAPPQSGRIEGFRFRPMPRQEPAPAGQPYSGYPTQTVPQGYEGFQQQGGVPGYWGQPSMQYQPSEQESGPRRRWTGNYGKTPQSFTGTPELNRNQAPYSNPNSPTDKQWGQPLLDFANPDSSFGPGYKDLYSVR